MIRTDCICSVKCTEAAWNYKSGRHSALQIACIYVYNHAQIVADAVAHDKSCLLKWESSGTLVQALAYSAVGPGFNSSVGLLVEGMFWGENSQGLVYREFPAGLYIPSFVM